MFLRYLLKSKEESTGNDGTKVPEGKPSLDSLLEEAEKEFEKEHPDLVKKDENSKKDDEKKDEEEDDDGSESKDKKDEKDEEKDDEELNAEQLAHAKSLFKLLTNPKTSRAALNSLAQSAGLDLKEVETKQEQKEATKTIKEIVQEKLGSKYEFLAGELGDLLQDLFESQVTEKTKDIRDKIAKNEVKDRITEIKAAQEEVLSTYKDVQPEILKEVLRISKAGEMIQGEGVSDAKFFKSCLILAADNLNLTLTKASSKTENKPVKKRSPLDELSNKGSGNGGGEDAKKTTQVKSQKDAILLAQEQIAAASKK